MKCTFYEATGKTTCPFHLMRHTTVTDANGCVVHTYMVARYRKTKRKTARRSYGKSR